WRAYVFSKGVNMQAFRNICLSSALGIVLLSGLLLTPAAAQSDGAQAQSGAAQPATEEAPPKGTDSGGTDTIGIRGEPLQSGLGREVRTSVEEEMGRIVDLLFDRTGRVKAAVIEFGGFLGIGTRKIAVEWSALHFEPDNKPPSIVLDMTRDQLRKAPEYK